MDKSKFYDDEIFPLMDQLIKKCRETGISMFACFHTPSEDDTGVYCITALKDGEGKFPPLIELLRYFVSNGTIPAKGSEIVKNDAGMEAGYHKKYLEE